MLYFKTFPLKHCTSVRQASFPSFWQAPAVPFDQSPGDLSESNSMKLPATQGVRHSPEIRTL